MAHGVLRHYAWAIFDTISTGWGGNLILNGMRVDGEPGHANITFDSPHHCGAGHTGCYEAFYSGSALEQQIAASVRAGAKPTIEESKFAASRPGTPYLAPQLLLNADHSMPVMKEEIFGPVAGLMKVSSDEQAIELMNDTVFGLTAAIWTADEDAALHIGDRIETGTWFMNRCDYLDPALAWVGVKDSGRGCTLSVVGYEHLTRPKSFHLRTRV